MDHLIHAFELTNERVAVSREAARMADEEGVNQQDGDEPEPQGAFHMELRDSLPGGRAVIGVEQEGSYVWLASKQHVSEQAVAEFEDQFQRIARERSWVQNWPGR